MRLGLRAILLLVAVIFFIVAALANNANEFDYLCIGLAFLAGGLLVEEMNFSGANFGIGPNDRNRN